LLDFLAGVGKSGHLHLFHGRWSGAIGFDRGEIVAASVGTAEGLPALEALVLAMAVCHFTFTDGPWVEARTIALPPDALRTYLAQLAALRVRGALPGPLLDAVPHLAEPPDGAAAGRSGLPSGVAAPPEAGEVVLDRRTLWTLAGVDGRRTVAEIVERRGTVEAVLEVAALAELGLIGFVSPAPAPPVPLAAAAALAAPAAGAQLRYWWRPLALAGVASLLLGLNAWQAARVPKVPRAVPAAVAGAGAREAPPVPGLPGLPDVPEHPQPSAGPHAGD
jgi:hypothetical protein